jgi:hypothetical protein
VDYKQLDKECINCVHKDTCAIKKQLHKLHFQYNFSLYSKLFIVIASICKYYVRSK